MNAKSKSLVLSIGLSVGFYVLDSVLDYVLFNQNLSFLQILITDPPIQELYTRLLGVCCIIVLGIILPVLFHDTASFNKSVSQEQWLSSDPSLMVNISNQIKTPLNAIMGFVDLLKDPGVSETSKNLYLSHIRTSGKYLVELIGNVTDITMIETGELYIKNEECTLNQMLSNIYQQYEKLIKEKEKKDLGILLKTSIKNENYTIITDEKRLNQVIVNLIENAISFTDEGTIEFGYNFIDNQTLEFFVKDTGTGLSSERLEMVFIHQKRVIDSSMRPFDIVSLRINICRHLVKLLGGELKVESHLGKGSDFRFKLMIKSVKLEEKLHELDEKEENKEKEETVEKKGLKDQSDPLTWEDKTILIAEDVESNYIYLQEILKPTGAKILWAENGKEAVNLCMKKKEIDVVLMDILMPEMDGYEAAKEIKKDLPDLPVIAQTAYHLDEEELKNSRNYFSKFLIKPIWSHDLLNALSDYLN